MSQQVNLIDISAGGVSIGVSGQDKLKIDVGENLILRFETDRLSDALEINAMLRHIKLVEEHLVYGVSFDQWDSERRSLAPQLRSLFNERQAVRVEPEEDQEIDLEITLHGHGTVANGLLRDISVLGIGIWIADEDQEVLGAKDNLTIDLRLPSDEEDITLAVTLRHTQHVGDRVRIGAQMVAEDAHQARRNEKTLINYVMKRQMEVARIDAERRRAMQAHYPTG